MAIIKKTAFFLIFLVLPAIMMAKKSPMPKGKHSEELDKLTTLPEKMDVSDAGDGTCLSDALKEVIQSCGGCCPPGWVKGGFFCYYMDGSSDVLWSEARKKCQQKGADLVVIRSARENSFLYDLVNKKTSGKWFGTWLGLEQKLDSQFYWVDGAPLRGKFSAWARGEPNNREEKCGLFWGPESSQPEKWNDAYCDFTIRVQQEKPKPLVLCQKPCS